MAEATHDKDNPFSFKSFMKRTSTDLTGHSEQLEKGGKNVKSTKKKKETRRKKNNDDVLFPEVEDPEKDADNPFSFTKFVKTKKTKKQSQATRLVGDGSSEGSSSELDDLFPPSKETPHRGPPPGPSKDTKVVSDPLIKSDIFESDSDSSFGLTEEDSLFFNKSSNAPIDLGPPLTSVPKTSDVSNGRTTSLTSRGSKDEDEDSDWFGSSLEASTKESPQVLSRVLAGEGESTLVRKLRAENEKLKGEVQKSHQATKKHKERNTSLQQELVALRRKEEEDTRSLEEMAQKVESNLVATTKRAATAEATIARLKQEIQSLQVQLAQASPQSVHQKYEEMLRGVREKANFASLQLVTASHKAEQSIRDLVTGAETLKTVAEILMFIDSIAEVKDGTKS
ncbi:endosome-associated-trafficking regulator 1-like isoform X2 [Halichondria panicea]|uniref:endosome-associated-trafficking regulator 1-like isoform X2 n=1 Tax=Halichondria panicea TaxID=6063 RepID=UPI00312BC86D